MSKKTHTDHSHRGFKGIWIPRELWLREDLSLIDKVMIAEIDSLDQEGRGCHATNAYFARFFGVTASRIQQVLRDLIARKEVESEMRNEWQRVLWVVKNYTGGGENSMPPMEKITPPPHGENYTHDNKGIDNKDNNTHDADASLVSFELANEAGRNPKKKKAAKNEDQIIREAQAEALLARYPKRQSCSMVVAIRVIASAVKKAGYEKLSSALTLYIARTKDWEEQYIKRPENWFKQEAWEEEFRIADLKLASNVPTSGQSKRTARKQSVTGTLEWERQQ